MSLVPTANYSLRSDSCALIAMEANGRSIKTSITREEQRARKTKPTPSKAYISLNAIFALMSEASAVVWLIHCLLMNHWHDIFDMLMTKKLHPHSPECVRAFFFSVVFRMIDCEIIIYGCCADCQSQVPNKVHVCVFFFRGCCIRLSFRCSMKRKRKTYPHTHLVRMHLHSIDKDKFSSVPADRLPLALRIIAWQQMYTKKTANARQSRDQLNVIRCGF